METFVIIIAALAATTGTITLIKSKYVREKVSQLMGKNRKQTISRIWTENEITKYTEKIKFINSLIQEYDQEQKKLIGTIKIRRKELRTSPATIILINKLNTLFDGVCEEYRLFLEDNYIISLPPEVKNDVASLGKRITQLVIYESKSVANLIVD